MGDIRGRVLEVKTGDTRGAYLYGFKVDRSELRRDHKAWLDSNLIQPAMFKGHLWGPYIRTPGAPTIRWYVWLCGTSSRTAGFEHNWDLSKKRARAVEEYIHSRLSGLQPAVTVDLTWFGEMPPLLAGRPDGVENPLDRAVLTVFKAVPTTPAVKPAPVPAPPPVTNDPYFLNPCCYLKMQIEYIEAVRDVFLYVLGKGGAGRPPQSFAGEPLDKAGVPMMTLDPTEAYMLQNFLRSKGWSEDRAKELSVDSSYTIIRIDGLEDHINKLDRELDRLRHTLNSRQCSPRDSLGVCASSRFRKNNNYKGTIIDSNRGLRVDEPTVIRPGPSGGKQP